MIFKMFTKVFINRSQNINFFGDMIADIIKFIYNDRKILIVFDDMIADMINSKKLNPLIQNRIVY